MQQEIRKIQIDPKIAISSVWAIPDAYCSANGSAVILAHGAGNDMEHPFLCHFHRAFAEAGLLSVKFNLPYTEMGRKAPDRMPVLENTWRAVIRVVREEPKLAPQRLFLAGKSMGGRVASHLAAQGEFCDGLIFLGYPLYPPKQTDKLRIEHWPQLSCPLLFLQGTRDSLCDLEALKAQLPRIVAPVTLHIVEGGDHSFKVPTSVGKSQQDVWQDISLAITTWITKTNTTKTPIALPPTPVHRDG